MKCAILSQSPRGDSLLFTPLGRGFVVDAIILGCVWGVAWYTMNKTERVLSSGLASQLCWVFLFCCFLRRVFQIQQGGARETIMDLESTVEM